MRAEVIGRHSGHEARPALLIEYEQVRVGPDIARVGRNEKRKVADQVQAAGPSSLLEACPLAEQQELCKADLIDRALEISAGAESAAGSRRTSSAGQSR